MKIRGSYLVLYSPIITFLLITIFVNIENIYCFFIENPNILTLLCIVCINIFILITNLVILIVYIVSVIITVFINLLKKTINWLDENFTAEW